MIDTEDTKRFAITFASHCIYEWTVQTASCTPTSKENGQLPKVKQQLKDFIRADTSLELNKVDITNFNWDSPKNKQMVARLYEHACRIWKALQEY